ncbi:MAG: DUF6249 domain-containing protein [Bacteroidota bacterium]
MEQQYGLQSAYIILASAVTVVLIVRSFTDFFLKRKMIELGYLDQKSDKRLNHYFFNDYSSSLKWGLIILFTGLGLITQELLPAEPHSILPYGIVLVFVSIGFLIYYLIVSKQLRSIQRLDQPPPKPY